MKSTNGPLTPAGLRVCADLCATCIFRPGNLMDLRSGRVRGMIDESVRGDAAIVCHKTLEGERAVCRGFWDRHSRDTLLCRLGAVLGVLEVNAEESGDV